MKIPQSNMAFKTMIKYRGFYDNDEVLQSIYNWFSENDFWFDVDKYKHTGLATGIKLKINISGTKKITEYLKWKAEVYIVVYDIEEVEVIKEGKKIKMHNGKFSAELKGTLILDWQKRFSQGNFLQKLGDFLRNYVLRYKIVDEWEDELADKMLELANLIKTKLGSEAV